MPGGPSTTSVYPVYEVRTESTDGDPSSRMVAAEQVDEQMGSKRKFWFRNPRNDTWYLFKYARENTGEHWSEKVACEIARVLGLPHAEVHLAVHDKRWGVLVEDIRADREHMSLLHGNELLLEIDPKYQAEKTYQLSQHTVEHVAKALQTHHIMLPESGLPRELPVGVDDAMGLFVGYLLLDALIGNTDRHHENWAAIGWAGPGWRVLQLAPTYDHASSLGRELLDSKRNQRLQGTLERGVSGYANRTRSAFYRGAGDPSPMSTHDAFLAAGQIRPQASDAWLSRCRLVGLEAFEAPVHQLPSSCTSNAASALACALIRYNYEKLLGPEEPAA